MATTCPSCGSSTPEAESLCSACGWDPVAKKHSGRPAGLDLFFPPAPEAPKPPPEAEPNPSFPFVDATPPVPASAAPPPEDPFAAITRKAEPKAAAFPSNLLDPLLESLQRSQPGREALSHPRAQAVVAELRKPGVFIGAAAGLAVLAAAGLYMLWPDSPPPPPPAPEPAAPEAYVRPTASFAGAPKAVVLSTAAR